jgi:hypothetical protein
MAGSFGQVAAGTKRLTIAQQSWTTLGKGLNMIAMKGGGQRSSAGFAAEAGQDG